jgi:hypothetical protein
MDNNDKGLIPIEIDLEKIKSNQLDESFLRMWGVWIKYALNRMFGGSSRPIRIRGKESDLQSLASVLGKERRYMESFVKNGLNDPSVLRNRYDLERAVYSFEKETGIKWPLK